MTEIEWAEKAWNPVTGCTKISLGCANCYADTMAVRLAGRYGYPPKPDQFKVTLHEDKLEEPLKWKKPRRVFVCSMGDLFHEDVPLETLGRIFHVISDCPQHTFIVLTKRPERMKDFPGWFSQHWMAEPSYWENHMKHVWLGVSCEDQERYDERVNVLLQIPAAVRFVSLEPLLGPIDLGTPRASVGGFPSPGGGYVRSLDWIIIGAESKGSRPGRYCNTGWVEDIVDQCDSSGVPVFVKQIQEGRFVGGIPCRGKLVKNPLIRGRVRQAYPEGYNG